jgi:hypothetical protein
MKHRVRTLALLAIVACGDSKREEHALRPPPPPPPLPVLDPVGVPIRIAPGECASGKVVFETGPRGIAASPQRFGDGNPFVALADELTRCLPGGAGTVVVELTVDANHRVTAARPFGTPGGAALDCVERVARTIRFVALDGPLVRCAFAYGTATVTELPSVELGVDRLTYHDDMSTMSGLITQPSPLFPALEEHFAHRVKVESTAELAARGPFIVKVQDAAPMDSVNRVLDGARQAHVMPILADATGKLVRGPDDGTFPTAPVLAGSGDGWVALRPRYLEDPRISIYVTPDANWIGISRLQQFERFVPRDWPDLEERLRAHKQEPLFADRTDLEIAGDGGVTYADILEAIARARAAGFPDWSLVTPEQLTTRPTLGQK